MTISSQTPPRLLVTAGPTHEPIDAVRYIGNRSSGRVGIAIADRAAALGWPVTLLLGPTSSIPSDSRITLHRFRTTAELQALLHRELPQTDILIMAAAVADYRPKFTHADTKLRRQSAGLTLELEPTPDLLADLAPRRTPSQTIVGFALEPRGQLLTSARSKLERKGLDLIVANPLETMDAQTIEATILSRRADLPPITTGLINKEAFAAQLLDIIAAFRRA